MKEFYEGMAEIFEVDFSDISPEFDLNGAEAPWDSLAIVSTIALVDRVFGKMLDGQKLKECKSIADIQLLIS